MLTNEEKIHLEKRIVQDIMFRMVGCKKGASTHISDRDMLGGSIDRIEYVKNEVIGAFAKEHIAGFVEVIDHPWIGGKEVRCEVVMIKPSHLQTLIESAIKSVFLTQ